MRRKKIEIIAKDEDIIVCIKPMGMSVSSDKTGDMDVLHQLANQVFMEEGCKEEPDLYLVHRLDRPVGGIMVFARSKESAANLSQQMKDHTFEKDYQAILTGWLPEDQGRMEDVLLRDGKTNCSKVVDSETKDGKKAVLYYEVIDFLETDQGRYTYCLIHLETGRHHQIRVQMASRHVGIWGDTKYNPLFQKTKKKYREIGLYATRIAFSHPRTGEKVEYRTEPRGEAFDLECE